MKSLGGGVVAVKNRGADAPEAIMGMANVQYRAVEPWPHGEPEATGATRDGVLRASQSHSNQIEMHVAKECVSLQVSPTIGPELSLGPWTGSGARQEPPQTALNPARLFA